MKRPNIVFILTDDQGYGDLGCTGNPVIKTPCIDELYTESARFTDFHVGPTCAPTRSTLMTGHYANSTGVWHTLGGRSLLRTNEWTLAAALRDNGYATAIFGKWHLGDSYPYRPIDRGFDFSIVHGGGGVGQTPDAWGNDYFDDTYLVNGIPQSFQGYCTDVFFAEALKFIQSTDQPFFCYIATNAPHQPYNVEPRYADPYKGLGPEARASFYGMITCIDENIGMLRTKLREWELDDNTVIVFMTDNGTSGGATTTDQGFVVDGYNAGMRGRKNSPYDGGHRVPFFIRWPAGGIDKGFNVNELTASIDFMPTILDLCDVEIPPGRSFHGRSLKPLLQNNGDGWPERVLVTDSQRVTNPIKWRQSAVMQSGWRLINGTELYHIASDPEQRKDVSGEFPDMVEKLRSAYDQWWEIVSEQMDEIIPLSIGVEHGREVCLNAHDWRNENSDCPWNQQHIRTAYMSNGHWEVQVENTGVYRFELRRWPRESGRPIAAGINGDDVSWRKDAVLPRWHDTYTNGVSLPICRAHLSIGDQFFTADVSALDGAVVFKAPLQQGCYLLRTAFYTDDAREFGAYYVYVKLLEA